jgi:hypothetical protein
MDCYIIASTLEGGWGFSNYKKKEGRIDEGRRGRREGRGNFIQSSTLNVYRNDTLANEYEKFIERDTYDSKIKIVNSVYMILGSMH